MIKYIILFSISGALSFLMTPIIRKIAIYLKAFDVPNQRKVHSKPIPRLGGVAIYLVFNIILVGLAKLEFLFINLEFLRSIHYEWIFLGSFFAFMIGLADDIEKIPPSLKFIFQIIGASIVSIGCCHIEFINLPFGSINLGYFAIPFTIVWIVAITNAINLLDGLDGLAGGTVVIISFALCGIAFMNNNLQIAILSLILSGTTLGFLRYNFHPASIFLGDSGAYYLGFMLGVLSILGNLKQAAAFSILIPILILGLPLLDTFLSIIRRLLKSLHLVGFDQERNRYKFFFIDNWSLFTADKGHIHHRLLRLGFSQKKAVLILYGVTLLLSILAFISVYFNNPNNAFILVIIGIGMYIAIKKLPYEEIQILQNGALLTIFDSPIITSRFFQVFIDVALIAFSYYLSFYFRFEQSFDISLKKFIFQSAPIVILIRFVSFYICGIYKEAWRYMSIPEVVRIFKAVFIGVTLSSLTLFLLPEFGLKSHTAIFIDGMLLFIMVVGVRSSYRVLEYFKFFSKGKAGKKKVLIYGSNKEGVNTLRELSANGVNIEVVGFIDEDGKRKGNIIYGCPVLGSLKNLKNILKEKDIAEIILSYSTASASIINELKEICRAHGVILRVFQSKIERIGLGEK